MYASKRFILACVIVVVGAVTLSEARADGISADLRAFLFKYRCDIYDRLVQIHDAGDPTSDRDRFIAINAPDGHYVQCKFHDDTRWLYCEAASGFYETTPGEQRKAYLPAAAVAGLAWLGFSTDDSHGNFSLDREVGALPDYMSLADLMLTTLYVAYGARAANDLRIDAPFAPLLKSTCDPTS